MAKVLLIDPDVESLGLDRLVASQFGWDLTAVTNLDDGWRQLLSQSYALVLLEILTDGPTRAFDFVQRMARRFSGIPLVVISDESSMNCAITALTSGSHAYLRKSLPSDSLRRASAHIGVSGGFRLVGQSSATRRTRELIERYAGSNASVLITGETGTGKELAALDIHRFSDRAQQPFVAVNCAALPPDLIESEIFGYTKGAFTGAESDRQGKFVAADGGTLFLDEIGELPISAQSKLLRVLETMEVVRLGENRAKKVDVRVVAATNQDLARGLRHGHFREDLFFRLNVVTLTLPPLRERYEDIDELVPHFVSLLNRENNQRFLRLSPSSNRMLRNYSWPGNVRELRNTIERAMVMCTEPELELQIPDVDMASVRTHISVSPLPGVSAWRDAIADDDPATATRVFLRQFIKARGNASAACRALGTDKSRSRTTQLVSEAIMEIIFGLCSAEGNIENLADAWGVSFATLLDTINAHGRVSRRIDELLGSYGDVQMISKVFEIPFSGLDETVRRVRDLSENARQTKPN